MKKYAASGFLLVLVLFFGTMHAMEDCCPTAMQKEILLKFSKDILYSHIIEFSLADAKEFLSLPTTVATVDKEVIKKVRRTIEHFDTLLALHNFGQLTLNHGQCIDKSSLSKTDTILECAIKMQQDGLYMIKLLASVTSLQYVLQEYKNAQGESLLHLAAAACNEPLIRWIFAQKSICFDNIINAVNMQGQTPLNVAMTSVNENESIITLFIEKGAIYSTPKSPVVRPREDITDEDCTLALDRVS